jgi:hypothetical protein
MKTPMPKHLRGIFKPELYARLVELSENGADYSETIQILTKENGPLLTTTEQNIYTLFREWGLTY